MNVLDLQRRLSSLGFDPGPLDGKRGPRTTNAVRAFQRTHGLVVDGIVGKQTSAALKQATTPAKAAAKPEPDKSAMALPAPAAADTSAKSDPPPNAPTLLSTARPISELIWHCAATPEGKDFTVADIRAWHKERGWSDVGYHYIVYRDGRIMAGRPIGQIGSHVAGRNTGTVGCAYIGGVSKDGKQAKDTRTDAQKASMLWLTEQLVRKFPITRVSGHNEFAAKACPSFNVPADALGNIPGFSRGQKAA